MRTGPGCSGDVDELVVIVEKVAAGRKRLIHAEFQLPSVPFKLRWRLALQPHVMWRLRGVER